MSAKQIKGPRQLPNIHTGTDTWLVARGNQLTGKIQYFIL